MTVREYMNRIEEKAPLALAYPWDHVGLMIGDADQEVTGVAVCVDLTLPVLEEAAKHGANLIITHHPVIFEPLATLDIHQGANRRILQAIRQRVAVVSYHTNLDRAPAPLGVNYNLAAAIGLPDIRQADDGFHYYGDLPTPVKADVFFREIGRALDTDVKALYNKGSEALIRRIGVSCGAFDGDTVWLRQYGIEALVTGEAKHAGIVDLSFTDTTVYFAGHYATEFPGIRTLASLLPGCVFVSEARAGDGALSR